MPKITLFATALFIILSTAIATLLFESVIQKTPSRSEIDSAINQAKFFYRQKKERNEDFSNGSCLSNALMPGWVADIVHNPRLPIDDLPENQCSAYREGRARHFIELDLEGNLVRAK